MGKCPVAFGPPGCAKPSTGIFGIIKSSLAESDTVGSLKAAAGFSPSRAGAPAAASRRHIARPMRKFVMMMVIMMVMMMMAMMMMAMMMVVMMMVVMMMVVMVVFMMAP